MERTLIGGQETSYLFSRLAEVNIVLPTKTFNLPEPLSYIFMGIMVLRLSTLYAYCEDQLELDVMTL